MYKRCPIAAGRVVARCDELERLDDCLHRLEQAGTEHACVILKFATAAVLLQSFAKRFIFFFLFIMGSCRRDRRVRLFTRMENGW